jgi:hypothetical protein
MRPVRSPKISLMSLTIGERRARNIPITKLKHPANQVAINVEISTIPARMASSSSDLGDMGTPPPSSNIELVAIVEPSNLVAESYPTSTETKESSDAEG